MGYDLSILIPARNEEFLSRTVKDILTHIRGNTEIIVVLDGEWVDPPVEQHERVTVIYHPKSIGQRAATNEACRLSKAKYVMKVDAHCAFDKGFDVKMMRDMQDDWTMIPVMRNLHAFNWICKKCGNKWYQSPTPQHCCSDGKGKVKNESCDSTEFEREIVWIPKKRPTNSAFRFDKNMKFQYWGGYKRRQEGDLVDTLSIQGSCFMLTRKKYWELDICSEDFHSWGQQGVEVACKTWLSGGRVVVNKNTWYAHLFRTQGGDFGFPYTQSPKKIEANRELSIDLFVNNKWKGAKHDFQWLIDKFSPVPEWSDGV
jgi:glycosyltransferase involved in cell wall biosynthesis